MIKPRPTQTRVKHQILDGYIEAWGGIIVNGARLHAARAKERGVPFEVHLIYVDANASSGRYDGEQAEAASKQERKAIFGSPIIGIKALDKLAAWAEARGVAVRTNSILVEIDAKEVAELQESLRLANLDYRVRNTADLASLRNGEIAILHADCVDVMPRIIDYTQSGRAFSLFFLDPYGPKALPLDYVANTISRPRHDVIVNMPYQDLHKKTGLAKKGGRTAAEDTVLGNYDRMFGRIEWRDIAKQLDRDDLWSELDGLPVLSGAGNVELELMSCYREALRDVDASLAVKAIGLLFPDRQRTMFYLYLTTHDPDGALAINKILWDANLQEQELRWQLWQAKRETATQMTMLPGFENMNPAPKAPERNDPARIGDEIFAMLQGRSLTLKEVRQALADSPYFANEIDRALTILGKTKQARYDQPRTSTSLIRFTQH